MIFAKTIDLVLSGRKTQTLRLAYAGDSLGKSADGRVAVLHDCGHFQHRHRVKPRWIVGHTYAVQPERCHAARGRVLVTDLFEVLDPLAVDDAFVHREGFDTVAEYVRVWHALHRKDPVQRCWAIVFELIERGGVPIPVPTAVGGAA